VSTLNAEAMELIEREIAAVRDAWVVLNAAGPEVRAAIMADVERDLLDTQAKMVRLEILRKYLDQAAQEREDEFPRTGTAG
jgi:hypothetical protein